MATVSIASLRRAEFPWLRVSPSGNFYVCISSDVGQLHAKDGLPSLVPVRLFAKCWAWIWRYLPVFLPPPTGMKWNRYTRRLDGVGSTSSG